MMNKKIFSMTIKHKFHGFSLVELMVGMIIGILGMVVMMQVYSSSEARKKTNSSGGDAQTNVSLALFSLQKEMRLAGYGISHFINPKSTILGCDIQLRAGVTLSNIAPITINHPAIPVGDPSTDTLLVVYGNSNGPQDGTTIKTVVQNNIYTMSNNFGFYANDRVVVLPPNPDPARPNERIAPCSLALDKITNNPQDAAFFNQIYLQYGAAITQGVVYNLGQSPKVNVYAIRNGNLTVCDYSTNDCGSAGNKNNSSIWVPIAINIVSMRAQYGKDSGLAGNTTPYKYHILTSFDQITPATQCDWFKTSSIRLVLVARSAQIDNYDVTPNALSWAGSFDANGDAAQIIDMTGTPNWTKYHYKSLVTLIPLQNINIQPAAC